MGKTDKVWFCVGCLLIATAMCWWFFIGNIFLRLPGEISIEEEYSGTITWQLDLTNTAPYQPGLERTTPLVVKHLLASDDQFYTTDAAVLREKTVFMGKGLEPVTFFSAYSLDRLTHLNISDANAHALVENNPCNRAGSYYPLLPREVLNTQTYPVWRDELGKPILATFLGEEDHDGTRILAFSLGGEELHTLPKAYCSVWGLPETIPFDKLNTFLSLEANINLDEALLHITPSLATEDQIVVGRARTQAAPTMYFLLSPQYTIRLEPESGLPIAFGPVEETVYMRIDYSVITGLAAVFNKYTDDPSIGEYIQNLMAKMEALDATALVPVFSYTYSPKLDSGKAALNTVTTWNKQAMFWSRVFPAYLGLAGLLLVFLVALSWYWGLYHHQTFLLHMPRWHLPRG